MTVVWHKRVLQAGTVDIPVGLPGEFKFHLDSAMDMSALDALRPVDSSLLVRGAAENLSVSETGSLNPTVVRVNDVSLSNLVASVGTAVNMITESPASYDRFRKPGTHRLLIEFAQRGALARASLARECGPGSVFDNRPDRMQIVSADPGEIFPFELLYDMEAPKSGAPICKRAEAALADDGPADAQEWCGGCGPRS